jgi:hypothetical protein
LGSVRPALRVFEGEAGQKVKDKVELDATIECGILHVLRSLPAMLVTINLKRILCNHEYLTDTTRIKIEQVS